VQNPEEGHIKSYMSALWKCPRVSRRLSKIKLCWLSVASFFSFLFVNCEQKLSRVRKDKYLTCIILLNCHFMWKPRCETGAWNQAVWYKKAFSAPKCFIFLTQLLLMLLKSYITWNTCPGRSENWIQTRGSWTFAYLCGKSWKQNHLRVNYIKKND